MATTGKPPIAKKPSLDLGPRHSQSFPAASIQHVSPQGEDPGYSEIDLNPTTAAPKPLEHQGSQSSEAVGTQQYASVNKSKKTRRSDKRPKMLEQGSTLYEVDLYKYDFICNFIAKPEENLPRGLIREDGRSISSRYKHIDLSNQEKGDTIKRWCQMYAVSIAVTSLNGISKADTAECLEGLLYCAHDTEHGVDIVHYKKDKMDIDDAIQSLSEEFTETCNSIDSTEGKSPVSPMMSKNAYYQHCFDNTASSISKEHSKDSPKSLSPALPPRGNHLFVVDDKQAPQTSSDARVSHKIPPYATAKRKPYVKGANVAVENRMVIDDTEAPTEVEQHINVGDRVKQECHDKPDESRDSVSTIPPYAVAREGKLLNPNIKVSNAMEESTEGSYPDDSDLYANMDVVPDEEQTKNADESVNTIPPYATARKSDGHFVFGSPPQNKEKLDNSDEDDYEDIDSVSPVKPRPMTISKQTFNYICQFVQPFDKVECSQEDRRKVNITFQDQKQVDEFSDIYQQVGPDLMVEGVKMSLKDNPELKDKLESQFQCIMYEPNHERDEVEILCRKPDIDQIKSVLGEQTNGSVNFIYEKAKEPEAVTLLRIDEPTPAFSCGFIIGNKQVFIHEADITKMKVKAIVNAANKNLSHGGGVAKAIRIAGGAKIVDSSNKYTKQHGPVKVSDVAVTEPGRLPCSKVLHAVGPQWTTNEAKQVEIKEQLHFTYENILKKADELNLETIAIPPVSSGKYRVPLEHVVQSLEHALLDVLPQKLKCSVVHIVDIKDDILKPLADRISASDKAEVLTQAQVEQGIKEVLGSAAGQHVVPKKKFREKFRAFFHKAQ